MITMRVKFLLVLYSMNYILLSQSVDIDHILHDINSTLTKLVDVKGLFDNYGSLDLGIWKKENGKVSAVFEKAYGLAQYKSLQTSLPNIKGEVIAKKIEEAVESLEDMPNVPALNSDRERNLYRIASNTKMFVGMAAMMMNKMYGLNLDERISPKYLDLTSLGRAHSWHKPRIKFGYVSNNFPNSSVYASKITFRHLLTHRSGLSRESKRGGHYSYGSSRTFTPVCPLQECEHVNFTRCNSNLKDRNWEFWASHVIKYMMPACGYNNYNEKSDLQSCLPGEYYHYSNAGYSLLGLALNNYIKSVSNMDLESWIKENIFEKLNMTNTVFTWANMNKEQKRNTAHGCHGGKNIQTCNPKLPITDFSDRGIKTMPGGIWSTVSDLSKFLLSLDEFDISEDLLSSYKEAQKDKASEEDDVHMPLKQFTYGHGSYIADNFTCNSNILGTYLQGAWGTVPGYTSYTITNPRPKEGQPQYAVVILRTQNYAKNLNLGNQARKLLWRLLHPDVPQAMLECPVKVFDNFSNGDRLNTGIEKSLKEESVPKHQGKLQCAP